MNDTAWKLIVMCLFTSLVTTSGIVLGSETANDAEIKAAVSDKTYQGTMLRIDGAFTEYYAADGSIRGNGYTGKWRTVNSQMCFTYGENPEKCWDMEIQGPSMIMFKNGAVDGNGILLEGNPGSF